MHRTEDIVMPNPSNKTIVAKASFVFLIVGGLLAAAQYIAIGMLHSAFRRLTSS